MRVEGRGVLEEIANYYLESEGAYRNWGKDEERNGVYALHGGFAIEGQNLTHYEEVKELSRQLIQFAQIPSNSVVLDAGCGAGALSYELLAQHKDAKVWGINIAHNQLISADSYRLSASVEGVCFSEQDYHRLAFPNETFDIVTFCESYIHSFDKTSLAQEVFRVIKSGGRVVMSDTFIKRSPKNKVEKTILGDLKAGWYLPTILRVGELESILEVAGFYSFVCCEHTQNIIDSSRRMREHTELRIREGNEASEIIKLSRKAVIACNEAFERGLTGYFFVKAYKPL